MAQIKVTIIENGSPVGAGWRLVYGDKVKTTDANGQIKWVNVSASYAASLAFNIVRPDGFAGPGGAGAVQAGGPQRDFGATVGIRPAADGEFGTLREPVAEPNRQAAE